MRFDKLTQAIAAGAVWRLGMSANDLQIVAADWPLGVTLYKGGAIIGSGNDVLAGDYVRGLDFDLVEITSTVAQDVTVLLSDGTSGSNRVVGEVSVISGELSRVKANQAFFLSNSILAGAGLYPAVQLWNPLGSGVNAVVTKISTFCDTAGVRIALRSSPAELAAGSAGSPKLLGGTSSAGTVNVSANAGPLPGSVLLSVGSGLALDTREFSLTEPVLIPPGRGLALDSRTAAVYLAVSFQWFEEPI